jgi:hypothetical protein
VVVHAVIPGLEAEAGGWWAWGLPGLLRETLSQSKNKQTTTKKRIPLTTAAKWIKYLQINLTKEVQDLYIENRKTLLKKIYFLLGNIVKVCGLEDLMLLRCQ